MADPKITALILVPAEGDPLGLLADGECGSRPPMVGWCACPSCGAGHWRADFARRLYVPCTHCKDPGGGSNWLHDTGRRALALKWNGGILQAGYWIASATLAFRDLPRAPLLPVYSEDEALTFAQVYADCGLGTLLALDAAGREVPLER